MAINKAKVLSAAQKHTQKRNWDKAIREYQKLVDADQTDVRSRLKIADLYVKCQREDDALDAYKQVAYFYLDDQIYDKAVAIFKMAITHASEDPQLRRDLGEAYHRLGRLRDALREFNQAARMYREREDQSAHRDVLERMVRLDPEDIGLRVQLAERYEKDGMREEAVGLLRYAAHKLEEEGRLDEFVRVAERIVFLKPSEFDERMKIVRLYVSNGDYKRALRHLQACFKQNPQDVETLQLLSRAFDRIGDHDKALLVYKELAKLYQKRGDEDHATQVYERVLEIDPRDRRARRVLARSEPVEPVAPIPYEPVSLQAATTVQSDEMLPQVEFLDDDLQDVMGLDAPPSSHDTDVEQEPVTQNVNPSKDFFSFTQETFDEIGDQIGLDQIDSYPQIERGEPVMLEPESIGMVRAPAEEELSDTAREIQGLLDEAQVFVKYNLLDKALGALQSLVMRHPEEIRARDLLAQVYLRQGSGVLAGDQFIEMAQLVRGQHDRVNEYLDRAARAFGDSQHVEMIARSLGLRDDQDDPTYKEAQIDLSMLDEADLGAAFDIFDDPSMMGGESSMVYELHEGEIDLIGDFDDSFLEAADEAQTHASQPSGSLLSDDALHSAGLSEDTDPDLFPEGAISLDGDVIDLLDLSELDPIEDLGELEDLSDLSIATNQTDLDRLHISEVDATAMFESLFSDESSHGQSLVERSFSGEQDLAAIAEFDFLLQQGLVDEAERALSELETQAPASRATQARRDELKRVQSGAFEFPGLQDMDVEQPSPSPATRNASYDMANSYLEMEFYAEALEEYQNALGDPEVAPYASYGTARCLVELGHVDEALRRIDALLSQGALPAELRAPIEQLLESLA